VTDNKGLDGVSNRFE